MWGPSVYIGTGVRDNKRIHVVNKEQAAGNAIQLGSGETWEEAFAEARLYLEKEREKFCACASKKQKQKQLMTDREAHDEAQRRWGQQAWVYKSDRGIFSGRGIFLVYASRYRRYATGVCAGSGDSWESAFADANMREPHAAPVTPGTREITKGVLGEPSKIREELDELEDAVSQGNTILAHCELADLYGALEAVAEKYGLSMEQLQVMADATKRAFQSGSRK